MNYILLSVCSILFANSWAMENIESNIITTQFLPLVETPTSPTTTIEINSGIYLQAGEIFNVLFTEIEERFPPYRRLVKDISELESSEQLLIEGGMDLFAFQIDLIHLKINKNNMFETVIEPEIQKVNKIQLLKSKIPGLNATQAASVLEELGIGE